jgi:polysaccharide pyruvyl transferase WcaK-like protein
MNMNQTKILQKAADQRLTINRRAFLGTGVSAVFGSQWVFAEAKAKRPRILLRSSWQTVNIGDIAHTPGVLALLEKHIPEAEVRLWPSKVTDGVDAMLAERFPNLKIISKPDELKAAFSECNFLLHGSGPSLVAEKDVVKWAESTGKPYGIYGITLPQQGSTATQPAPDSVLEKTISVLSNSRFVFFRDGVSLDLAKRKGCRAPVMGFGPDGAFATDLRDEAKAVAFLKEHKLEEGQFLCCIARLRFSEYWKMKPGVALDEVKHARNEAMREHDLAPLRAAIVEVVRNTTMKVLLCPEDSSQMEVNRVNLYDKLPEDVKARVVWRSTYWLPSEALSVYVRSAGLFGAEMHSPIMCIGSGIPAVVCRWAEQTSKGFMWRDIGLQEWLFTLDNEEELQRVAPAVLAIAKDPAAARAKAALGRDAVFKHQQSTMAVLRRELGL